MANTNFDSENGEMSVLQKSRKEICNWITQELNEKHKNHQLTLQNFSVYIANLIQKRLVFYFVHLFFLYEDGVSYMHGASGEVGKIYTSWANCIVVLNSPITIRTPIYTAIRENIIVIGDLFHGGFLTGKLPQQSETKSILSLHPREDIETLPPHPLTPHARTEIIIPFRSTQGRVAGALCLYSTIPDDFTMQDIATFLSLADSITHIWEDLTPKAPT
jgi:hypothetical protein